MDFTYPELQFEALNTPADDWRILFNYMLENNLRTLLDAGAGNAISAQVAQAEYNAIHVTAFELLESRLKGVHCPNHDVQAADLMKVAIPRCDITFLYLPTGPLLERVVSQLHKGDLIAAVESHGELFDRLDENCKLVDELEINAKRHNKFMRIYEWSTPLQDMKNQIRSLSFKNTYAQIQVSDQDPFEGQCEWLADIEGATVTPDGFVETISPNRRFHLSQVTKITNYPEINLIKQRRLGFWRKIFVSPRQVIEKASGERIALNGQTTSLE